MNGEFEANLGYIGRLYLKKKMRKRRKTGK